MRIERVEFERVGGFTGIPLRLDLETNLLSPEEAQSLEELAESVDFFSLPRTVGLQGQARDAFKYRVTLHSAGRHHLVVVSSPPTETLQPLLDFLTKLARKVRAQHGSK